MPSQHVIELLGVDAFHGAHRRPPCKEVPPDHVLPGAGGFKRANIGFHTFAPCSVPTSTQSVTPRTSRSVQRRLPRASARSARTRREVGNDLIVPTQICLGDARRSLGIARTRWVREILCPDLVDLPMHEILSRRGVMQQERKAREREQRKLATSGRIWCDGSRRDTRIGGRRRSRSCTGSWTRAGINPPGQA